MASGVWWGHNMGNCFYICLCRKYISKIFWRRTTVPEKLKFIWKLNNIVQIQICKNHAPGRSGEVIMGEAVLHVFICENHFLKSFSKEPLAQKKLKFLWKLSDIVQKHFLDNRWNCFTCVYVEKHFYPLAQLAVKGIYHHVHV
jgi:hypothetical protein